MNNLKVRALIPWIILTALLCGLACWWLHQSKGPEKKILRPKLTLEKKTLPSDLSLLQTSGYIIQGIDTSLEILGHKDKESYTFIGKKIESLCLYNALSALKTLILRGKDIKEAIDETFFIYGLKKGREQQPRLLLTGYYQPELEGSLEKKVGFETPVLAVPDDLISVRLRDFDNSLPSVTLWGLVKNRKLKPYWTRAEIEERIQQYRPLCWLKNSVDLLELQVQGSGIISLQGRKRFVHFGASNGRPYVSVGKELLRQGLVPRSKLTWQGIKQWALEHPDTFRRILNKNQRYVFFQWEKDGPLGCFGKRLVEGVSAALDRRLYPPSIPLLVEVTFPDNYPHLPWMKETNDQKVYLLLFNHDTGSAIKGYFRADLYSGSGPKALGLAGRLKAKANAYVLLPRMGQPVKQK